ncbi:MAG TPA: ATP-binding cassette domain-containing protein, partial [Clostridia bacterium]|nr:ATP-binding cassette domain-containing protein [Clostridia bacterium]
MSARVEIREVSKIFARQGSEDTLQALDRVSLDVPPGAFVTLLGASGCGKSTLLRMVAGLEKPTRGEVLFNDTPIRDTDPRRGLVFQEHTLFPWLTVRRNIAFALKSTGQYAGKKGEIDRWIALAGLSGFADN